MSDRLFFSIAAALAVGIVAIAAVFPQGYGARSPGPFGHTPLWQTPQMQAALAQEAAGRAKKSRPTPTPPRTGP